MWAAAPPLLAGGEATDPHWDKVVFCPAVDAANNVTAVTDRSTYRHIVSPNGDAKNSTTQFKVGTSALYFDGTGDFYSLPTHNVLYPEAQDFTIEAWIYLASTSGLRAIVGLANGSAANSNYAFQLLISSGQIQFDIFSGTTQYGGVVGSTLSTNTWYHVALVRDGNNLRRFLNGVEQGSPVNVTGVTANSPSNSVLHVGQIQGFYPLSGYIDGLRYTKGVARYTSTFTPSFQKYKLLDRNRKKMVALLLGNQDSTGNVYDHLGRRYTRAGSAAISTSDWYNGGASLSFTASTSDVITSPTTTAFGTAFAGNFTVEMMVKVGSVSSYNLIFDNRLNSLLGIGVYYGGTSTDSGKIVLSDNTTTVARSGNVLTTSWSHVAIVRNGTDVSVYVNGTRQLQYTDSRTYTAKAFKLGSDGTNAPSAFFIDGLTIYNYAKYTGASTTAWIRAPAAPFDTKFDNNTLLLPFGAANASTVFADVLGHGMTNAGSPTHSTTQTRFGPTSLSLPGTGACIYTASSPDYAFGTGDFTLECWFYATSINKINWLFGQFNDGVGLRINASNQLVVRHINNADRITSTATVAANTWYHVAVSRVAGTMYLLLDGGVIGSATVNDNYVEGPMYVGGFQGVASGDSFVGYISDVRVTKGVGRYTNPTPTDAPAFLPAHPITSLLNFDGANNATSTTDDAGVSWTFNGNAKISTDQYKFGTASLYLDGTGDYLSATSQAAFGMSTNDFTLEAWVKTSKKDVVLFDNRTTTHAGVFQATSATTGYMGYYDPTTGAKTGVTNLSDDAWHHVAWVRRAGVMYMFADGKLEASFANTQDFGTTRPARIGAPYSGSADFLGYIDGFRLTVGAALYGPPYTPHPLYKG